MSGYFYKDSISNFLVEDPDKTIGRLSSESQFADLLSQKSSWKVEIDILKETLKGIDGIIYFEYSIPRIGLL